MSAQFFPLRSSVQALTEFLDAYYNRTLPPEIAFFRPLGPFVYMATLFYPAGGRGLDWSSPHFRQNEQYFLIPVQRCRMQGGRAVPIEVGCVTPYIFVDSSASATLGRESYGWPKQFDQVAQIEPAGARPPMHLERYLRTTRPIPQLQGGDLHDALFLAIDRVRMMDEPNLRNLKLRVTNADSHLRDLFDMARTCIDRQTMEAVSGTTHPKMFWENMRTVARGLLDAMRTNGQILCFNLIQFPHAGDPQVAGYQALMRTELSIGKLRNMVLLGDAHPNNTDLSRGFRIRVYQRSLAPIVTSLGLNVHRQHWAKQSSDTPIESEDFDTLSPVVPFGVTFDGGSTGTRRICWRAESSPWYSDDDRVLVPKPRKNALAAYNPALGPPYSRPFDAFGNFSFHVNSKFLVLPAFEERLNLLCRALLPASSGYSARVRKLAGTSCVVATFSHERPLEKRSRGTLDWLTGNTVNFLIPIHLHHDGVVQEAFLEAYTFNDNPYTNETARELSGARSQHATIRSSSGEWLTEPFLRDWRNLVTVSAPAIRDLNLGQAIKALPLVDVRHYEPQATTNWPKLPMDQIKSIRQGLPTTVDAQKYIKIIHVSSIPSLQDHGHKPALLRIICQTVELRLRPDHQGKAKFRELSGLAMLVHYQDSHRLAQTLGLKGTPLQPGESEAQALDDLRVLCPALLAAESASVVTARMVHTLATWDPPRGWVKHARMPASPSPSETHDPSAYT